MARRRVFSSMGPGLRAVHHASDGKFYVLTSPGTSVAVFDAKGMPLKKVPDYSPNAGPASPELRAIQFGEDMDVDANGTVYVADRGADQVKVWEQNGSAHGFRVTSLVSLAALPDGEVAVTTLQQSHLVTVYGSNGKVAREFGDPESFSSRPDLDRYANLGRVVSDPQGHVYYGFTYRPEPLVRQYDRFGYAGSFFEFVGVDAFPEAQAMRKEIERQETRNARPFLRPILTAFGVDPVSGDVWMGLHNTLVHFDKDGNRRSEYQVYTPSGARLEASIILVEEETLLIGSDPLGVYEFARPDRKH
jgi:outer membrane protein assembly factor BamB